MKISKLFVTVLTALTIASCGKEETKPTYEVVFKSAKTTDCTACLYVLLPEYDKVQLLDSVKPQAGVYRFHGSIGDAAEAFVRLKGDTIAYSFVLTDNRITIVADSSLYRIYGSRSNDRLTRLLSQKIVNREYCRKINQSYLRLVADSTLTRTDEDSLKNLFDVEQRRFSKFVVSELSRDVADYPVMSRLALRLFYTDLLLEDRDSLMKIVKREE